MKTKLQFLFILLALSIGIHQATAQGTSAFTYQGQLHDNGTNANGAYTIIFALYDSPGNGNLIAGPATNNTTLVNGLFTVNLDFGAGAFNGGTRYLDITVSTGGTTQELSPRVQVLPAPYALYAAIAGTVTNGAIMNAQLAAKAIATTNLQTGAVTNQNLTANAVNATNIASGQVVKGLNGLSDFVILSAGANLALTTNANALQISTGSNMVAASEGNLAIVRGIVKNNNGNATNFFGTGYSVSSTFAGTGGTEFFIPGIPIELFPGDNQFDVGPETGYFPVGSIFMVEGGSNFYVVQNVQFIGTNEYGVDQYQVTFSPSYQDYYPSGPDVFVEGMTLNPTFTISYTTPFSSPPTVLVSVSGGDVGQSEIGSPDTLSVTRSNVVAALSGFTVISQNVSLGLGNGGPIDQGDNFDFIAIGPK